MNKKKTFYESFKRIAFTFCAVLMTAVLPAHAATLPAGYTELEYIQSTGTQYIDTGYKPNINGYKAKLKIRKTDSDMRWTGVIGSFEKVSKSCKFGFDNNGMFAITAGSDIRSSIQVLSDTDYIVETSIISGNISLQVNNQTILTSTNTFETPVHLNLWLFSYNRNGSVYPNESFAGRIYYTEIYDSNDTLVRNFVPCKNPSNVVGMCDAVNGVFYQNAGSGAFTAGPAVCRNLLDISTSTTGSYIDGDGSLTASSNFAYSSLIPVEPNTKYIVSGHSNTGAVNRRLHAYDANGNWLAQLGMASQLAAGTDYTIPVTTTAGTKYVKLSYYINDTNVQIEQGETLTDYAPYCSDKIKIATTKYNEDAFANLVTTLNSAITKVTNIVNDTVSQANSIGELAQTKQDRPADGDCPAGRKCLLVTGTDGKPHWYLIQE